MSSEGTQNGTQTRTAEEQAQINELVSRAIVREIPDGEESSGPLPEGYQSAGVVEFPANIEELAAKARLKRIDLCKKEINAVLEKHNCTLDIALAVGDQLIRLNMVVALPGSVQVISK